MSSILNSIIRITSASETEMSVDVMTLISLLGSPVRGSLSWTACLPSLCCTDHAGSFW